MDLIAGAGFQCHLLPAECRNATTTTNELPKHANWLGADWKTDAEQTIAAIGETQPDWLIVDHYGIDHRWESRLRTQCRRIMAIDDLADRPHDCDLLLDQNLVPNHETRYNALIPEQSTLLLGPKFALLQPQYAELHLSRSANAPQAKHILVYFGGADNQNLTTLAVEVLCELNHLNLTADVVINPRSRHAKAVENQVKHLPWATLHTQLKSLAPLMQQAHLAIGAAGATTWERCCLGLPAITITMADNQLETANYLSQIGAAEYLGPQETITKLTLRAAVERFLRDGGRTSKASAICRKIVDGQGTDRVSEILHLGPSSNLEARPANAADESMLLRLANDPMVRASSFNAHMIDHDTHHQWLLERLRSPEKHQIYIIETSKQLPVGVVRFQRQGEHYELHYALIRVARSRGIASQAISVALTTHRKDVGVSTIAARVKKSNIASRKILEKLGFAAREETETEIRYFTIF